MLLFNPNTPVNIEKSKCFFSVQKLSHRKVPGSKTREITLQSFIEEFQRAESRAVTQILYTYRFSQNKVFLCKTYFNYKNTYPSFNTISNPLVLP